MLKRFLSKGAFCTAKGPSFYASYDPTRLLKDFQPSFIVEKEPETRMSKLSNGIKVFTHRSPLPGIVDAAFVFNVGTRDETPETAMSLNTIASNFWLTNRCENGIENLY